MAPYLYDTLFVIMKALMKRFVKAEVINEADTAAKLLKIDVSTDSKSIKPYKDVDIGFSARRAIPKTASDLQRMAFMKESYLFLSTVVKKLAEKSPLKNKLVRGLGALQPKVVSTSKLIAKSRMSICLQALFNANRITSTEADLARQEFETFIEATTCSEMEFNESEERLDTFWTKMLRGPAYSTLFNVVKQLLILSHGNTTIESGFSVNEQLLVENLQERSLVNQRVVYDSIKAVGGVSQVDICSEMLKFVRSSGTRYNQALDENRQKSMHETEHISKKRRAQIELKELEDKKRKLDEVAKAEKASIDMKMAELKKLM